MQLTIKKTEKSEIHISDFGKTRQATQKKSHVFLLH